MALLLALATPGFAQEPSAPKAQCETTPEFLAKLEAPVSLEFGYGKLEDICTYLEKNYKLNFVIDQRAMKRSAFRSGPAANLPAYEPSKGTVMNFTAQGVPLRRALDDMLAPAGLAYEVTGNLVWISNQELIEHDHSATRRAPRHGLDSGDQASPALQKALGKKVSIEFEEIKLTMALKFIQDMHKVNISVDDRAVGGSDNSHRVSSGVISYINLEKVCLADALTAMLRGMNLAWQAKGDHIWVTSHALLE